MDVVKFKLWINLEPSWFCDMEFLPVSGTQCLLLPASRNSKTCLPSPLRCLDGLTRLDWKSVLLFPLPCENKRSLEALVDSKRHVFTSCAILVRNWRPTLQPRRTYLPFKLMEFEFKAQKGLKHLTLGQDTCSSRSLARLFVLQLLREVIENNLPKSVQSCSNLSFLKYQEEKVPQESSCLS